MKKIIFLKIVSLIVFCFNTHLLFGVNKFIGRNFGRPHWCIHGGFEGVSDFKTTHSPDERFTATIKPKDGLCVINNDNQKTILKINNVEINDFGFSSDNRYFFVDYRYRRGAKSFSKSSIDVFNLFLPEKILTIPQYNLLSYSRRKKTNNCDFNDFITFEFVGNTCVIKQKLKQADEIDKIRDVSTVKYCNGSNFFACLLKNGALKIFEMNNFEVKELFVFAQYSYQDPGKSFYRP